MPSHRDIAKRAEVAVSTVSLVLNNKPGVSDAMRQKVLGAAEELTKEQHDLEPYAPSQSAELISIVVLHATEIYPTPFFQRLLRGIQSAADRFGVQLRLANYLPEQFNELHQHEYLADPHLRPSGVLIVESQHFDVLSTYMQELNIPYVIRTDPSVVPSLPAVGTDEMNTGYIATQHLLKLGHRKIAFVGGGNRMPPYKETYYARRRFEGYKAALQEYDITPDNEWISISPDGQLATETVLDGQPNITALLFTTYAIAQKGVPVLDDRHISIPDDLSVIVLDDLLDQNQYQPQLTTVRRFGEKEGYWSIKLLLDIIHEPEILHGQYMFQVSIVERESCKPLEQNS
jgi:LacI family transcriptional regulator